MGRFGPPPSLRRQPRLPGDFSRPGSWFKGYKASNENRTEPQGWSQGLTALRSEGGGATWWPEKENRRDPSAKAGAALSTAAPPTHPRKKETRLVS